MADTGALSNKEHEEMETGSGDESASDDSEEDYEEAEKKRGELEEKLRVNPYDYNLHVEYITELKNAGELDRLRKAREKMHSLYPFSEELWLDWLREEMNLATTPEERERVTKLFERAVKDYASVAVWLEFVQFSIGGMGGEGGMERVRDTYERALTTVGLHVTLGANIWEAYREYENAVLAGLMPTPGKMASKEEEEAFNAQNNRLASIFKRQLAIPLQDMEKTMEEFEEWQGKKADPQTQAAFDKALALLQQCQSFEDKLVAAEAPRLAEYQEYLEFELSQDDPARITCLFERAVVENCLNAQIWLQYILYLVNKLRVPSQTLAVLERAVRNCPWSGRLWQEYLLAQERHGADFNTLKALVDRALTSGMVEATDFRMVWGTYCEYLRRRINWDADHAEPLETFQLTMDKAVDHLFINFGADGDPNGSLRQFWANIEANHCKNMERAREIWNGLMMEGYGNKALMWLQYYRMERAYGDNKHARRILQRAVNSVTDWLETVTEAYLNFEREEGNLESYDQAVQRCETQLQRMLERQAQQAEKEVVARDHKKQGKKQQKKQGQAAPTAQHQPRQQQQQSKQQSKQQQQQQQQPQARKRKLEDRDADSAEGANAGGDFKVPPPPKQARGPPPPGFKGAEGDQKKGPPPPGYKPPPLQEGRGSPPPGCKPPPSGDSRGPPPPGCKPPPSGDSRGPPPPGYKPPPSGDSRGPPPPGYKGSAPEGKGEGEAAQDEQREEEVASGSSFIHHPAKDDQTVFVSNLLFDVTEEKLKEIFSTCGEVAEVRLVRNFKGKSKGYAYVEFTSMMPVEAALQMDRQLVEGRPMFVSPCETRSNKSKAQFRYPTELETNKLFIKNLPFSCTREALETIFSQHGKVKDLRLVTYRSGAPKGLAYVEYESSEDAKQAVMKTDGILVGEHQISVAISNPPRRKQPMEERGEASWMPSLGGGKRESEFRGKARTQLSLVPRAVNRPGAKPVPPKPAANESSTASAESPKPADSNSRPKMTNADFRNMLLKK